MEQTLSGHMPLSKRLYAGPLPISPKSKNTSCMTVSIVSLLYCTISFLLVLKVFLKGLKGFDVQYSKRQRSSFVRDK